MEALYGFYLCWPVLLDNKYSDYSGMRLWKAENEKDCG